MQWCNLQKEVRVSIPSLEKELYAFSFINYIEHNVFLRQQGSEMTYSIFIEHLLYIKKSDRNGKREKEQTCGFRWWLRFWSFWFGEEGGTSMCMCLSRPLERLTWNHSQRSVTLSPNRAKWDLKSQVWISVGDQWESKEDWEQTERADLESAVSPQNALVKTPPNPP